MAKQHKQSSIGYTLGLKQRVHKAGQSPGTFVYTGLSTQPTQLRVVSYDHQHIQESVKDVFPEALAEVQFSPGGYTWVHVTGLQNVVLIKTIAAHYELHPLTVEDILNVSQRPKVESFEEYLFIAFYALLWPEEEAHFDAVQVSVVIGKQFVLLFEDRATHLFDTMRERLFASPQQRLREQGVDYLAYRILDSMMDQSFVILERMGDAIEDTEEQLVSRVSVQESRTLYPRLYEMKRQLLGLRKILWPVRDVMSHLLREETPFIHPFTRVYLRDAYDHSVQAIDALETFRDVLSGLMELYLSRLTHRMNEVMKVLTIIATLFIPITFLASIYGMNFEDMPELHWRWGYPAVLGVMLLTTVGMLWYFRRKKWF
ncbi:MAG: magnesium and cobalt transport protein CorA [Gammaproteobacteria bacterium RIFCSPHIGHO2_12_FULL_45_9]|nr:MAG: magnesium and cobalt transport protein CorA [Gammaproteobacteria bacterium RIFCSPHIGHO2_12_FULL_45_9]